MDKAPDISLIPSQFLKVRVSELARAAECSEAQVRRYLRGTPVGAASALRIEEAIAPKCPGDGGKEAEVEGSQFRSIDLDPESTEDS